MCVCVCVCVCVQETCLVCFCNVALYQTYTRPIRVLLESRFVINAWCVCRLSSDFAGWADGDVGAACV